MTTGDFEKFLKDVWLSFDIKDMLGNEDLSNHKPINSILNVKPIEDIKSLLMHEKWGATNFAATLDYIDDNIEVFMTLASLEGIPYKTTPSKGNGLSYSVLKSHLDYIKFNFSKDPNKPSTNNIPYAYNLQFRSDYYFGDDHNWLKLIESSRATAAFPFGFQPRTVKRLRKEYDGKLFYLNYTTPRSSDVKKNIDYTKIEPAWPAGNPDDDFDMEYVDGGTFNDEPNDLARGSIIQSLNLPDYQIPNNGTDTNACVILINPLPNNFDKSSMPGTQVTGIPTLFQLPQYLIGAMMDQGRFRPDWIEKALDDNYYSRFLISPTREDAKGEKADLPLAGGLLGAFSGFIDKSFREHDYKLGHYNTYQFLSNYFIIPTDNIEINYANNVAPALLAKYEAVGWYIPKKSIDEKDHCQIIPRTIEPNLINSLQQPQWPTISMEKWGNIRALAMERARNLADAATDFNAIGETIADPLIWKFFLKGKVEKILDKVEQELIDNKLLRG